MAILGLEDIGKSHYKMKQHNFISEAPEMKSLPNSINVLISLLQHLIYARQVLARMEEFVHLMTMTATHSDVSV